jgi:hypothetical protein
LHGDRERLLRFGRFPPFVESVRRNQAAALDECLAVRQGFIDGLSPRVDGSVSNLLVFAQWGIRPQLSWSKDRRRRRPSLVSGLKRVARTFWLGAML